VYFDGRAHDDSLLSPQPLGHGMSTASNPGRLKLSRVVARYGRYDLLAIDELGYVRLDQHSAELLFQILTEREERAAVAVASNAPFSEWSKTFTDPRLAAAVVDRITYRAHIIQTGTTSYRPNNR
jgi:DNA replication protein DnaC